MFDNKKNCHNQFFEHFYDKSFFGDEKFQIDCDNKSPYNLLKVPKNCVTSDNNEMWLSHPQKYISSF